MIVLAQNPVFNGITFDDKIRSSSTLYSKRDSHRRGGFRMRETEKKTEWRRQERRAPRDICDANGPVEAIYSGLVVLISDHRAEYHRSLELTLQIDGSICVASCRRCGGGAAAAGKSQDAARRRLPWEATSDVPPACHLLDLSRCFSLVLPLFLSPFLSLSHPCRECREAHMADMAWNAKTRCVTIRFLTISRHVNWRSLAEDTRRRPARWNGPPERSRACGYQGEIAIPVFTSFRLRRRRFHRRFFAVLSSRWETRVTMNTRGCGSSPRDWWWSSWQREKPTTTQMIIHRRAGPGGLCDRQI